MTLQECYAAMGANYDEALQRLRSERLVQKYTLKFLDDSSYELLCRSMESHDDAEAFRAAHTIKGVCQNLSFTKLGQSSHDLTEALRTGRTPEADGLFAQVQADYKETVDVISAFRESLG